MEKELVHSHIRNCSKQYGDWNIENIYQGSYTAKTDYSRLGSVIEGNVPIWYMQNNTLTSRTSYRPTMFYHGTDHMNVIRRKPIAKDNTGALKLWLLQHKKNPYPNKPEKIMLAILSRMTLTQVSTWFANARRRLKKEFPEDEFDILTDSMQQSSCYTDN